VVSSERMVLWRSEIFGGISNEISVLLDQSTLPRDMKGFAFGLEIIFFHFHSLFFQPKATWPRERSIPRLSFVWEIQHITGRV
jgi:hypothetical protein